MPKDSSLRAIGLGLALGVWYLVVALFYRWAAHSELLFGKGVPQQYTGLLFTRVAPKWLILAAASVLLLPPLAVWLWRLFERRFRLDPDGLVSSALKWSASSILDRSVFVAVAGSLVLLFASSFSAIAGLIATYAALIASLILPFGILMPSVIEGLRGRITRPRWPGAAVIAAVAGWLITSRVIDFLIERLTIRLPMTAAVAADWVIAPLLSGVCILAAAEVFTYRRPISAVVRSIPRSVSWRRMGLLIALQARLLFIFAVLLAPVAAMSIWRWKDLPIFAAWLSNRDRVLPAGARALMSVVVFVSDYWFPVWLIVVAVFGSFLFGRIVWLESRSQIALAAESTSTAASTPA